MTFILLNAGFNHTGCLAVFKGHGVSSYFVESFFLYKLNNVCVDVTWPDGSIH